MKNTPPVDPNSKALRERYTRLLGLEQDDFVLEEKKAKDNSLIRWCLFLLLLSVAVLGIWFFFNSLMEGIENLAPDPQAEDRQQQSSSAKSALSTGYQAGPDNSEQAENVDQTGKSVTLDKPIGADNPKIKQPGYDSDKLKHDGMNRQPITQGSFLVVLLSTKSKDEAIERAKLLSNSGYASEVILSSSGYYGVVLRQDTGEQAEAAMNAIVASGAVKEKPYIMKADRVREFIYPETK